MFLYEKSGLTADEFMDAVMGVYQDTMSNLDDSDLAIMKSGQFLYGFAVNPENPSDSLLFLGSELRSQEFERQGFVVIVDDSFEDARIWDSENFHSFLENAVWTLVSDEEAW